MLNKLFPKQGIFSIPLVREIAVILIFKLMVLFTIQYFYFSDPVPFNADHIFGEVQQIDDK
ncbi:cytochrome oxidase putative small subunit CydP [Psychromonas sp. CD1]|uniref:cytochrome oxidase putative small subunit CydP n=1 Tax=Psychromonas sp. CD1 TaxID=1979839 RepID=UPI000B9BE175|nr:cytochrome oxidase putative small subunit CydP [Psychromonas sp. CD1]